jgi:hypothetical protein
MDRFWRGAVEFVQEHSGDSDTVVLPDAMAGVPRRTIRYSEFLEDAQFDFFILHKGMLASFSSRFIKGLVRSPGLCFANEVFIVFSRRPLAASADPRHVEGFRRELEKLGTEGPATRGEPIFLTGRFRSGTTVLWNLFNVQEGYTAYYEPLNDCLIEGVRHTRPMESHRGVSSYWEAYNPLLDALPKVHRREFAYQRLLLERDDEHQALKAYIDFLIEGTRKHRPVLQFNRVDLRLPWLRSTYPHARIVHIFRDPRNAWVSSRRHLPEAEWENPYHPDGYELFQWIVALRRDLPFLVGVKNAYEAHYYLSRLSRVMGECLADCSIDFDRELKTGTERALHKLVQSGCLEPEEIPRAQSVIKSVEELPWSHVRSDAWFRDIESRCDAVLNHTGLAQGLGRLSLKQIRGRQQAAWEAIGHPREDKLVEALLETASVHRSQITRLLGMVREREEPLGPYRKAS